MVRLRPDKRMSVPTLDDTNYVGVGAHMTNFGYVLRAFMHDNRHSLRTLGKEIGVSKATLHRIVEGKHIDGQIMLKVINWIFKEVP